MDIDMSKAGSWLNMEPWDTGFYITFKDGAMRVGHSAYLASFPLSCGNSIVIFLWGATSSSLSALMSWCQMLLFSFTPALEEDLSGHLKSIRRFLLEWSERRSSLLVVAVGRRACASLNYSHISLPNQQSRSLMAHDSKHWSSRWHVCGLVGSSALNVFCFSGTSRLPSGYSRGDSRSTWDRQMKIGNYS